jgi:hypothetical protein
LSHDLFDVREKIESGVLAREDMNRPFEFRMSTAGFCQRQMEIMILQGKPPFEIGTAMRLLLGEPIHQFWREHLTAIYGADFQHAEAELELVIDVDGTPLVVKGHADGYLKSIDSVVEVKSVSSASFLKLQNQGVPYPAHYEQANIYAKALGATRILFIYHCRDSGAFELMAATYDEALATKTCEKWANVYRNTRAGIVSPRAYENAVSTPCCYCPFNSECYEGYSEAVSKYKRIAIQDANAIEMATKYLTHREQRLVSEKLEDSIKTELARYMTAAQVNEMQVDIDGQAFADVTLKIGKNNNPLVNIKDRRAK